MISRLYWFTRTTKEGKLSYHLSPSMSDSVRILKHYAASDLNQLSPITSDDFHTDDRAPRVISESQFKSMLIERRLSA